MDYVRNSYMDCVPLVAKIWNLLGKFQNIPDIMDFLHLDGEDFHTANKGGNKAIRSSAHKHVLYLPNFFVYYPRDETPQEIEPFEDIHTYISQKEFNAGINYWVKSAAGILKSLSSLLMRNVGEQSRYGSRHGVLKTTRIIGPMSL